LSVRWRTHWRTVSGPSSTSAQSSSSRRILSSRASCSARQPLSCQIALKTTSFDAPWSNSSPSGPLCRVLRLRARQFCLWMFGAGTHACVPSTASKVWYRNSPIAQLAYTHRGQSWSSVGVYHSSVRKFMTTKPKPVSVICLGQPAHRRPKGGRTRFGLRAERSARGFFKAGRGRTPCSGGTF
jgi:hypothetical protein